MSAYYLYTIYIVYPLDSKIISEILQCTAVSNELKGTSIPPKMRKNFALQTSWHHSVEMKKIYSLKKIKFEKTKNYQKLPLDFLPEDWLECNTIRTNFLNCLNLVSISKNVVFYAFWAVTIYKYLADFVNI